MISTELPKTREENKTFPLLKSEIDKELTNTEQHQGKIIAITSANAGQGKSLISENLAKSITQSKFNTVLLKTSATDHSETDLSTEKGLSNYLKDEAKLGEVIFHIPGSSLSVINAGSNLESCEHLINSRKMLELLTQLRQFYDFVIIDSPSLECPYSSFLSKQADVTTLVVDSSNSNSKDVLRAEELLSSANIEISGIILNRTQV